MTNHFYHLNRTAAGRRNDRPRDEPQPRERAQRRVDFRPVLLCVLLASAFAHAATSPISSHHIPRSATDTAKDTATDTATGSATGGSGMDSNAEETDRLDPTPGLCAPGADRAPMQNGTTHIMVVLDRSGSMARGGYLGELKRELVGLLRSQRAAHHARGRQLRVAVNVFDHATERLEHAGQTRDEDSALGAAALVGCGGDGAMRALEAALRSVHPRGSTRLYDTVLEAVGQLESEAAAYDEGTGGSGGGSTKLLYVVTDGRDNQSQWGSQRRLRQRIEALREAGGWATVFLGTEEADALATGRHMGFDRGSTLSVGRSKRAAEGTFSAVARYTDRMVEASLMAEKSQSGGGGKLLRDIFAGAARAAAFTASERRVAAD